MQNSSKFILATLVFTLLSLNATPTLGSDFRVLFGDPNTEVEAEFMHSIQNSGRVTALVRRLGSSISLPAILTIQLGSEAGAFFDPETASIHIPYSFPLEVLGLDGEHLSEGAEISAIGVLTFVLYHEISHALFHLLDLGPLPDEEEAADGLATVLAIEFGHADSTLASAVTVLYARQAAANGFGASSLPEPKMSLSRYQRLMCWVAGGGSLHLEEIAAHAGISTEQIQRCPGDYQELRSSLLTWLEPHLVH